MKGTGPRADPCGTTLVTGSNLDCILPVWHVQSCLIGRTGAIIAHNLTVWRCYGGTPKEWYGSPCHMPQSDQGEWGVRVMLDHALIKQTFSWCPGGCKWSGIEVQAVWQLWCKSGKLAEVQQLRSGTFQPGPVASEISLIVVSQESRKQFGC